MAGIEIRAFGGMQPSANAKSLPESAATLARNLDLRYADFRPLPVALDTNNPLTAGQTLYRLQNTGLFITSPSIVNYVRGPIPNDPLERTYYTGDGAPKVVTQANQVRQLGVPAPSSAPSLQANVNDEYSTDDAATAQAGKLAEMVAAVRSSCAWQFVGLTDAELADRFTPNVNEPAKWSYSLKVPGFMNAGVFTPTHNQHVSLMDDRLHFHIGTVNGYQMGLVDLDVRGQKLALSVNDMADKLGAITNPEDPSKKLLNQDHILALKSTLVDSLAPLDTAYEQSVTRLRALKEQFITAADTGSVSAASVVVEMRAFYQRTEVVSAIDAAVDAAVDAIYSALRTYENKSYVRNPTTGGESYDPNFYYDTP